MWHFFIVLSLLILAGAFMSLAETAEMAAKRMFPDIEQNEQRLREQAQERRKRAHRPGWLSLLLSKAAGPTTTSESDSHNGQD